VYDASSDAYDLSQTIVETGDVSSQTVPCQSGKRFTVPYIVYEKVTSCGNYPPDGVVTFSNITIECDGQPCTSAVKWEAKVEDPNCEMTAHVDKYPDELSITWDTSLTSRYDNYTTAELYALNGGRGWGARAVAAMLEKQS